MLVSFSTVLADRHQSTNWFQGSALEPTELRALPGLRDKGQFVYFLTIRFLGFSFLQSAELLRFAPNGAATI